MQSTSDAILYLDIDSFHFKSIGFDSAILQRAFDRQVSCPIPNARSPCMKRGDLSA